MATGVFLFTDLEGSTRLWSDFPVAMRGALAVHDDVIAEAVATAGGVVFKHTGDGLCATFPTVADAIRAAVATQRALGAVDWGEVSELHVRMAIHVGEAEQRGDDWFGPGLNRAARLMAIGHGGQILLSAPAMDLARDATTPGIDAIDLGVHRLRDLAAPQHVWQVVADDLPREFAPLRSLGRYRGNLPVHLSSFLGREAEMDDIVIEVLAHRLVTLVGPGGVGKTRLALQASAQVVDKFPDGVWFIELAPISDDGSVEQVVATTLGLAPRHGASAGDIILDVVGDWRSLLIVDNCEHLLEPVRLLVRRLLSAAPNVAVLATSREALRLDGEVVWPVPPLPVDGVAVELFTERAVAVNRGLVRDGVDFDSVRAICRRLDGVPLAIELAAARMRSMTSVELLARLDQRFRLLSRGPVVSDGRHASLQAALDWSYDLLSAEERRFFVRLSVFAGGFSLEAAHAVAGPSDEDELATLDLLDALAEKSLLSVRQRHGVTRYELLETMRQYGVDRLGVAEVEVLRHAHAEHFARFAQRARAGMRGPHDVTWVVLVEEDFDNLRTAVQFAVERADHDTAMRIVASLEPFNVTRRKPEVWEWAGAALSVPGAEANPLAVGACLVLAFGGHAQDHELDAERWALRAAELHRALELPADPRLGIVLAYGLAYQGRVAEATAIIRKSLEIAEASGPGHEFDCLEALHQLVFMDTFRGTVDVASGEQGLERARRHGNTWMLARACMALGFALGPTDPDRGRELLEEAVSLCRRPAHPYWVGTTLVLLAIAHADRDPAEGLRRLAVSLDEYRATGLRQWTRRGLRDVMAAFGALGHHEAVALIDGASKPTPSRLNAVAAARRSAMEHLGAERYEALVAEASRVSDDALSERVRAEIDVALQRSSQS